MAATKEQLASLAKAVQQGNASLASSLLSETPLPASASTSEGAQEALAIANILLLAVQCKKHDALSALLSAKPELAAKPMFGWKAIDFAGTTSDTDALQRFVDGGWDANEGPGAHSPQRPLLGFVVKQRNAALCKWLLERGASPNVADSHGATPLEWAAQFLDADGVAELLDHGADVAGSDALHFAALRGKIANAQLLVARGAHPSKPEKEGPVVAEPKRRARTPLRVAVEARQAPMASWLLQQGARPDEVDANGMSVLDVAVQLTRAFRDDAIERMLREWQAPPLTTAAAREMPIRGADDIRGEPEQGPS